MAGLFKSLVEVFFDFQRDVDDLTDRLETADKNEHALVAQITRLQEEIERLRAKVAQLESENTKLRK